MKIFYIANFNDIYSEKWAKYFEDNGHAITRYHLKKPKMKDLKKLKLTIGDIKPDILHSQYCGKWALLGMLTGFHPHIVTIHGSEVLLTKGWKRYLVQKILERADLVTTDGYNVIEKIKGWGIEPSKIRLVNFGFDIDHFRPIPELRSSIPHLVVRYGTGVPIYDLSTFGMAYRSEVFTYCSVRTLKEYSQEEAPQVFNRAWTYISTALSDAGLAGTTHEAMACGLPVVITNVADNHLWVDKEYLFEPGDYRKLREIIMRLLENPEERKRQGKKNRETIVSRNNYQVEMAKMNQIYLTEVLSWQRKKKKLKALIPLKG